LWHVHPIVRSFVNWENDNSDNEFALSSNGYQDYIANDFFGWKTLIGTSEEKKDWPALFLELAVQEEPEGNIWLEIEHLKYSVRVDQLQNGRWKLTVDAFWILQFG
jgi:hypothetical protein